MNDITIATSSAASHSLTSGRRLGRVRCAARAAGRDLVYLTAVLGSSIAGYPAGAVGVSLTLSLCLLVFGVLVWVPVAMAAAAWQASIAASSAGTGTVRSSLAIAGRRPTA